MAIGSQLWWVGFPGNQGENYVHATAEQIRQMGDIKWLNSLSMFEYAFVLLSSNVIKLGHNPETMYTALYVNRMLPILNAYHKKLMHYRMDRSILEFDHASEQQWVTNKSVTQEALKMEVYTKQTRRALRNAVEDYIEHYNDPSLPATPLEDLLPESFPVAPSDQA